MVSFVRPSALIAIILIILSFHTYAEVTTSLGKTISIPPSQFWDGKHHGPWSTFRIQVGTPPQQVHILPASDQSSTWLILPEACTDAPHDCSTNRGEVYMRNESSTWEEYGSFGLNTFLESRVNRNGDGLYGNETIQLGWVGDGLPAVEQQVIAGITTKDFWLGSLALNPRPMNFTDYNDPRPSLLHSLRDSSTPIPSMSWSYTAGAYNLAPKVFGSLVLGGYDSTRFVPNNVTFPFGADISLDFQVAIQSIATNVTDQPLLSSGIISYIDTLVAGIWLPMEVCRRFEDAFGLVWDNGTQLYWLNDTLHTSLLAKNPRVTFKVGPAVSGPAVTIEMPYFNFYQTATSHLTGNSSGLYFPLKRAANDTQYILGRTFLQSVYMSADYERNIFNLSQALYPSTSVAENIISVIPPSLSNDTSFIKPKQRSSLPTGVIAGIAAGGGVALIVTVIALFLTYRHKKIQPKGHKLEDVCIT